MRATSFALPVLVLAMLCAAGPAQAQIASFDCAKAESDTEWAICNTPQLGALDIRMAAYYALLETVAGPGSSFAQTLTQGQAAWIDGTRNPCGGDVSCLASAYGNRITALSDLARSSLAVK